MGAEEVTRPPEPPRFRDDFAIVDTEIDPSACAEAVRDPRCGAVATFLGTVRGENGGRRVLHLEYEVLESMARKQFARLAAALREKGAWHVAIRHRRGRVEVGGVSVVIAVSSPRRVHALEACALAIERLKKDVPIWKKEVYPDGHLWREGS
ncbi:MAG TPA: molybdenum cofactor biosynthesis protein MoaE [Planctomycetota bacterium]|nr:molybdenum cofactor biosynthesis protein MoaE [Planctomycetota bacterium]